jgi:arabinan endo-1,5-alpha-L-arabinosidase
VEHRVSGHRRIGLAAAALLLAVAGVLVAWQRPAAAATGDIRMHDPSVIKVGSCFYGFSTGFEGGPGGGAVTIRRTCDATLYGGWTYVGTVWNSPPAWITRRLGQTPPNFWAPDINYFNGRYHLYYAASIWGQGTAAMGLLTATNIEGPWTDAGEVTNVNYPIDANIAWSGSTPYVMWGSFRGIYLHVLDAANGKLSTTNHNLWRLASNIENATISFNGGYFYLFGSRGSCCIGVRSSYYTVVGRSTSISGPYLDRNGVDLANGGGTTIMTGSGTQVAAGGGDVFTDGANTRLAYHFYDATTNGLETLNIRTVSYSGGWPTVSGPVGANAVPAFRLTNVNSGRVAEVAGQSATDGGDVVQWGWNGGTHQQWEFRDAGGGYSRVVNRNSGKCLDVSTGSTADGADVLQWTCGTGTNQQWRLAPVGRNFQLVARHSGRCLTVAGGSTADAANIVQSGCSTSATMLWTRQ